MAIFFFQFFIIFFLGDISVIIWPGSPLAYHVWQFLLQYHFSQCYTVSAQLLRSTSVCLSVCPWRAWAGSKQRICESIYSLRWLARDLAQLWNKNSAKITATVFPRWQVVEGGMKKSRFSTNISLYLGNDTRQYIATAGSRRQFIEWCHFQLEVSMHHLSGEMQYRQALEQFLQN